MLGGAEVKVGKARENYPANFLPRKSEWPDNEYDGPQFRALLSGSENATEIESAEMRHIH